MVIHLVTNAWTGNKVVRLSTLYLCASCPPAKNLKPCHWFKILDFLDRQHLQKLMQVDKAFCGLVENYLEKFHSLYHPRNIPRMNTLIKSGHYFYSPSLVDIKSFLLTKGKHQVLLYNAYFNGNLLNVHGSFLGNHNKLYTETFNIVPKSINYWRNTGIIMNSLRIVPTYRFPKWSTQKSPIDKVNKILKHDQSQIFSLQDLALYAASRILTKSQVSKLILPKRQQEKLFKIVPEKHLSDQEIIDALDPTFLILRL